MNKHQNANGVPKLNIAMPSPASDNIDIDPFIIEGIWMLNLKFQEIKFVNQSMLTSNISMIRAVPT